ncbi:mechanosensitive channel MscK [Pseudomonas songnenensis]|jgi:potassium efflux system protein|uniref:Mechanosensitive channel MscK n=1 Tax=Pseudomonas songnenensis TaxID=1176259 RepID=A0A482UC13_9PSED|nr:mechanosensitive channel MscK [Pseudomonas songnenensis]MCQ4301589.1 mechanosensitive channel MscK [Pseudomonas songnenensis]RMH99441.1 mechanosensitive channel MscK [Pseudomonas songnenensis]RYJ64121.1 mechanosensitive channel MscK [Pseudomonas songnenensis]
MSLLRTLLFSTICLFVAPLHAQSLESLTGTPPAAEGEAKPAQLSLGEQTQRMVQQTETSNKRAEDLKALLAQAPKEIAEAQRELAKLKASPDEDPAQRYAKQTVEALEQRLSARVEELSEWQKQFSAANSMIITAQTRPERAQAQISTAQTRIQEINNLLKSGRESGKPLSEERRALLDAEIVSLTAQIDLRRQELAGNSLLQDLGKARRDLLAERIARAEQDTQALQGLINEKRRAESEQTVAEFSARVQQAGSDKLLAAESAENLKLSDYLLRATERLNRLNQQNLRTRQQLDTLNQTDQALEEQIAVLEGSLLLSRILYQQKQALPSLQLDKNLADEIADIRLYQFELNQRREAAGNPAAYVEQLLAQQKEEEITPELRRTLMDLATTRSELLDRLNRELDALLNASITLQLNQKQLQDTARTLSDTLDEQMFWIPSNKPLDLGWLQGSVQRLKMQLAAMPWLSAIQELGAGLKERPLFFLPLLLLIAGLLWWRKTIDAKLSSLSEQIGHFRNDSQLHTPLALLLNLLLALPGALFLALCGYLLQMDARGQNYVLGAALYEMAQAWLVFYSAYRMLSPGRVAELHFGWSRPQVAFLRDEIRRLGMIVMALVAVVSVAEHQPARLADDVLGILVVLACFALMSWRLNRLLLKGPSSQNAPPLRLMIGLLFSMLPIALIVAVGFGYYYTALKLTDRLIDTLYLLMIWIVVEAALIRGLTVAARRLAYKRALAKRQAQTEEPGDTVETQGEPGLDIEQVNQQSLRLTRMTMFGVFLVALYWVWSDLISVVSYLDNITLYEYTSGSGDTLTTAAISLNNLLGALLIIAVTVALARNLPGLLEVMVLSKLRLAQGSAYATTTLLSYALAGFGIVATLSTLGVSWDKLQWLVAALSVGLGFGLQEIFANFISGLIILFERPVRIGDVVTIGNLSGTVSRIRIRATTITDFDRKDIIVPNKTFITGQLINWSLSDTVTRVTLKVGVAYGSDLEAVRKLLLQAARDNPRVLKEPEPQVLFLNFGESTLDHELRIHVRDLGDRNPATDEINRFIDREFNKAGINIAFRQVDVFLKNFAGQQLQLSATPKPADEQKPSTDDRG